MYILYSIKTIKTMETRCKPHICVCVCVCVCVLQVFRKLTIPRKPVVQILYLPANIFTTKMLNCNIFVPGKKNVIYISLISLLKFAVRPKTYSIFSHQNQKQTKKSKHILHQTLQISILFSLFHRKLHFLF